MNPLGLVFLVAALVVVFGRLFARYWLLARYRDRRITGRTAVVLLVAVTVVPYVLLTIWAVIQAPEWWWIYLLLLVAIWPVIVLPTVAVFYQAKERQERVDQSERDPG